ncbi:fructose-specific PTS transporter subunit EIIC [Lactobacillus kullabergensis]|uniref:PTS fructose transporter subunit IIC n=1 Tax=Lactobacillus TaxID=1578 RepID=UPI0018DB9A3E|nr:MULTISPECIES: fructose-specific PTS transporter subunit EIIC [Lactobacillus]MCT6888437.1 fructose-specific PTS transporter subunit EIIC [Lactobacillus sp.]MBI0121241.1 PTS transporter subunit EIIC [Lactobacillus sp. M0398]MBI0123388.1 PTS transporter subunit EIIC [Lactobacillus sp. W8174]MBI0135547.1 PTS transporter subunit EIIC [Lactobacillus sp. W8173]MCX0291590.1 fructose-specific PTS transporter subunit EIIC [Lactobacillus kullabergensis]
MSVLKREINRIKGALMTGVGYMIPFVIFGGIYIALATALSTSGKGIAITNPILKTLNSFGTTSMQLMVPILAAFIAFGFADRAAIMPGFLGGLIAYKNGAGFLGGIVAGILAGYVVMWTKSLCKPIPASLKALVPIFIVPLIDGLIVVVIMKYIVVAPVAGIMSSMTAFLKSMSNGNAILLAAILGFMTAFDMGGPVNVVACLFAWAYFDQGIYTLAAPVAVAICTPPLGMGLATLFAPKLWDESQKSAGKAALLMGIIGISEGAIPFAAEDPLKVIPANCIGGIVGAIIAMLAGCEEYAPQGGIIVTPVATHKIMFVIAILVGSIVTAICINIFKVGLKGKNK